MKDHIETEIKYFNMIGISYNLIYRYRINFTVRIKYINQLLLYEVYIRVSFLYYFNIAVISRI